METHARADAEREQSRDARLLRIMAPILRWRYPIIAAAAVLSCAQHVRGTGRDWYYFVTGSELLFGIHHRYSLRPGGFHLYANYPDFQIGPLSFVVATYSVLSRPR